MFTERESAAIKDSAKVTDTRGIDKYGKAVIQESEIKFKELPMSSKPDQQSLGGIERKAI